MGGEAGMEGEDEEGGIEGGSIGKNEVGQERVVPAPAADEVGRERGGEEGGSKGEVVDPGGRVQVSGGGGGEEAEEGEGRVGREGGEGDVQVETLSHQGKTRRRRGREEGRGGGGRNTLSSTRLITLTRAPSVPPSPKSLIGQPHGFCQRGSEHDVSIGQYINVSPPFPP